MDNSQWRTLCNGCHQMAGVVLLDFLHPSRSLPLWSTNARRRTNRFLHGMEFLGILGYLPDGLVWVQAQSYFHNPLFKL